MPLAALAARLFGGRSSYSESDSDPLYDEGDERARLPCRGALELDVALLFNGKGREDLALCEEAFAADFGVDRNGGSEAILEPVGWGHGGTLVSDEIISNR